MKHLYILLLVSALCGFNRSFAQTFTVSPGDTFTYSGTLNSMTDSHEQNGYFVNNSGASNTLYWKVIASNMDSVWQMSFCDPENCYYFTSATTSFPSHHFTADTGSNLLRFGVSPSCSADSGSLVVLAWFSSDSAASVKTLYFYANYTGSCALAIQNVAAPRLSIFPNPVSSNLTIDGLTGFRNVKLTVYDVLGNVAVEKYIAQPSEAATLNTSGLQNGVYFVTVDNDGNRLLTKRIQKLD